jgi:hypothetical protein
MLFLVCPRAGSFVRQSVVMVALLLHVQYSTHNYRALRAACDLPYALALAGVLRQHCTAWGLCKSWNTRCAVRVPFGQHQSC